MAKISLDDVPLSAVDREALERAIDMARQESPEQRRQIDHMLAEDDWDEVARFAAYCCQDRQLKLRPWQMPPCQMCGDIDAVLAGIDRDHHGAGHDYRGYRQAALLLGQLLAAGLSKYEPDPETALRRKAAN